MRSRDGQEDGRAVQGVRRQGEWQALRRRVVRRLQGFLQEEHQEARRYVSNPPTFFLESARFPLNIGGKGCVFPRPGRLRPWGRVHSTFPPILSGKRKREVRMPV